MELNNIKNNIIRGNIIIKLYTLSTNNSYVPICMSCHEKLITLTYAILEKCHLIKLLNLNIDLTLGVLSMNVV